MVKLLKPLLEHIFFSVRYPFELFLFQYFSSTAYERLRVQDFFDFAITAFAQQVAHYVFADHLARFLLRPVHHLIGVERIEQTGLQTIGGRPVGGHVQHQVFEHVLVIFCGGTGSDIVVVVRPLCHHLLFSQHHSRRPAVMIRNGYPTITTIVVCLFAFDSFVVRWLLLVWNTGRRESTISCAPNRRRRRTRRSETNSFGIVN